MHEQETNFYTCNTFYCFHFVLWFNASVYLFPADILTILEHMNHSLEHCRRSLLNHLERRRQIFPRFYFLSMEDVLHIVCNGREQCNRLVTKLNCMLLALNWICNTCKCCYIHWSIPLVPQVSEWVPRKNDRNRNVIRRKTKTIHCRTNQWFTV